MKIKRGLVISGMVVMASLALAGTSLAHALLVRSIPAANAELLQSPAAIEMWFSESLEPSFSSARLLAASGQEVAAGAATVDTADPNHLTLPVSQLTPGIYTVAWRTLSSVDGHEWYGSFPFTVLNPDGSRPGGTVTDLGLQTRSELPTPLQAAARWVSLLGGIVFLGAPLFLKAAVIGRTGENAEFELRLSTLVVKSLRAAVLAIILGSWLQIALQAGGLESLALLPRLIYGTRLGALALARQTLTVGGLLSVLTQVRRQSPPRHDRPAFNVFVVYECVVLLLVLIAGLEGEAVIAALTLIVSAVVFALTWRARRTGPATQPWGMVLVLGAVALLTFSVGSHAGAVPGSAWAVLGDYIHLLAASAWIGGLLLLPILIGQMRRSGGPIERDSLWSIVRRYSYLASFAVFLLIVTGLFNSLVHFPTLASLIATTYGRVLLIKVLIMAGVLGIAFLNNRLVHREMNRPRAESDLRRLNRQISFEALIGLALMLSVAVLVQTQPPNDAASQANAFQPDLPFNELAQADDLNMHVQITPNQAGVNRFWVYLYHVDGSPIGDVQLVRLLFNYRDAELGQANANLTQVDRDTFALDGAYLNQAGAWDLSIYVRRRGMDDAIASVHLDVPVAAAVSARADPLQNPIPTMPIAGLWAGLMITLGVMPFIWHRLLRRTRPALFPMLVVTGGIFIGVGVAVGAPSVPILISHLGAGMNTPVQPGITQSATVGDVQLTLRVAPAHPGDNEFAVDTIDPRPGAQSTPGQVLLRFKMMDMDMGLLQAEATTTDQQHYSTRGSYLGMGGHWQIDVTLRRPGFDDVTHVFDVEILRPTTLP